MATPELMQRLDALDAALQRHSSAAASVGGSSMGSFMLGALLTATLAALIWYRFNATLHKASVRNKQRQAAEALSDMDTDQLKRLLGDVPLPVWAAFPDFERVKWVDRILAQLQPHMAQMASDWANANADGLLKQNKPGWVRSIHMTKFTSGTKPPHITGVKVFSEEDLGGTDQVVIEMDVGVNSDAELAISVMPLPKAKIPVVQNLVVVDKAINALTSLVRVKVSVQNLSVSGRVRITLGPLMARPPLVGSLQVALTEVPKFSFDLRLYGGDVGILPGLEAWLYGLITDSVFRQYTLPEKFVVPLVPEAQLGVERPVGLVEVEVLEAENVPRMDLLSASDPYVRLFTRITRQVSTPVIQNAKHPVWRDERFMLMVHHLEAQSLTAVLMDYDAIGNDDEIGRVELKLSDLPKNEKVDRWFVVLPPGPVDVEGRRKPKVLNVGKQAVDRVEQPISGLKVQSARKACRMHLRLLYVDFPKDQMESAGKEMKQRGGGPAAERAALQRLDPELRRLMGGGVLYVRVVSAEDLDLGHKPWIVGGWRHKIKAKVCFADLQKATPILVGSMHSYNFDSELEFVLDGDAVGREEEGEGQVRVEVWDVNWKNVSLGWATVVFKSLRNGKPMVQALQLQGAEHGRVEVRCQWVGMMASE